MAKCPWPIVRKDGFKYRKAPGGTLYLDDVRVIREKDKFYIQEGSGWGHVGFTMSRSRAQKLYKRLQMALTERD